SLRLSGTVLSKNIISIIVKSIPPKSKLRSLSLSNIESLNSESFAALSGLTSIQSLDLSRTSINDKDISTLKPMPALKELNVSSAPLKKPDFTALSKFKQLKTIKFTETGLESSCIKSLSQCVSLTDIQVDQTKVSNDALPYFANMPNLQRLDVYGAGCSASYINKFKKEHPNIFVLF
ncbi:MAG: hypothetical protein K2X81_12470, partial [Candidatus Obscuribacterales bacterium]|nr:hypothetical protein [Candidatus Obscuribacterales bacterium]